MIILCVVSFITGENWLLNYLYQKWKCDLLNILGTPLINLFVKMYIINSSLWIFPITPKYHPLSYEKIETHKPFESFVFQFNAVHIMERIKAFFARSIFLYIKISSITSSLQKKILPFPTDFFLVIEFNDWQSYLKNEPFQMPYIFGMVIRHGSYVCP